MTAATAQELQSDSVLQALNRNGAVFAQDTAGKNGGYPILWFENGQKNADCQLTQASAANGTFTVSQTGAVRFGASVSLTAQPAAGYRLAYFTANGNQILGDYYTVTGDTELIVVSAAKAEEKPAEEKPAEETKTGFTDVLDTDWFKADVEKAVESKLMTGTSATTFEPNKAVTREQLAKFLFNYAVYQGMDAVTLSENLSSFADHDTVSGYAVPAMQWAVGQGLINGTAGKRMPSGTATRCQFAAILNRFTASQSEKA